MWAAWEYIFKLTTRSDNIDWLSFIPYKQRVVRLAYETFYRDVSRKFSKDYQVTSHVKRTSRITLPGSRPRCPM